MHESRPKVSCSVAVQNSDLPAPLAHPLERHPNMGTMEAVGVESADKLLTDRHFNDLGK
jgi:hypothetical protein